MNKSPGRGSLLVIFLTVFVDLLGFGIVLPLLPIYAEEFSVDESGLQLGLLMASFSAMQFIFAPIWGRISDRIGRRPVILIGLLGSTVFYVIFGVATMQKSLWLMFLSRIGAGVAGATISTAQAYIADTTSLEKRSRGMALIGMAFGLGFTFGPLLGYLAVPTGVGDPGPMPGYIAGALSFVAFVLAIFALPESLHSDSETAAHRLTLPALREALAVPSVRAILLSIFVCVFSFANFETTLALMIKGRDSVFAFSFRDVCLTFAYIGFVLAVVQGGAVRQLAGRISEGVLAGFGAVAEIVGFGTLMLASHFESVGLLCLALTILVSGFAFINPSLNSLLSRRSDPKWQGGILGVGQSLSSLARILGAGIGIPLLKIDPLLPSFAAMILMAIGLVFIVRGDRMGRDYQVSA
ncbi:MAG: MFS transporter [Planctomycetaceae bacterium]|nr:MFS transporter [Planctomycetaceae bacterium]